MEKAVVLLSGGLGWLVAGRVLRSMTVPVLMSH